MAIKEESFRIGCNRYLQGKGYTDRLGDEVLRLGSSPLIVGGRTALSVTREKIEKSLDAKGIRYEFIEHRGSCNEERAREIAEYAVTHGFDVIVGAGGGVICDFAKLCGHSAGLPVINLPTSSATCAAYTPLSVVYTPEGRTVGTRHYTYEVGCVIADTEVIATQPVRLLLSGVFDAMAKLLEIKHRYHGETEDYPLGLDYAYVMAQRSYNVLTTLAEKCIEDMKNGIVSEAVEQVIFTAIAATGVISGIARGSNQTALGHKFYETTRLLFPEASSPYLHGEIVGVGLLLQNHYNGEEESNEGLMGLMRKYGMPCTPAEVGVNMDSFEDYYTKICNSSSIDKNNAEECQRFRRSLEYFWRLK